ncbi:hypothetical protein [Dactylosporangium sp. NPDC049140]|uniref:hypothetical protein n=1 Tax=Dactylosporangium sp. NPDC049140 TaxID=3155647 RepID=UPI0033EB17E6
MDVAVKGLSATVGPYPVQDVARELLRLARAGLEAHGALALLDPVEEVCETMQTFADRALDAWDRGEQHYLHAFTSRV